MKADERETKRIAGLAGKRKTDLWGFTITGNTIRFRRGQKTYLAKIFEFGQGKYGAIGPNSEPLVVHGNILRKPFNAEEEQLVLEKSRNQKLQIRIRH